MQQLQQQNQQLQDQLQQQQGEIQGLTATVNQIAGAVQATQAAVQQLVANQVAAQVQEDGVPVDPPQGQQVLEENPAAPAQAPIQLPAIVGQFTLEKFIKNGAKSFKGSTEPQEAESWMLNMLKSFRAMEVPENHWVRLASCRLEEEAAFWWEAAQRTNFVGRALETITWAEFIEAFNVTYYPEQVREQKSREFSNLEQGVMTVREYEQKFIQLERFAPGLCATEKARTSKFVWGLRFALKDRVANQRARTLAEAVAIACVSKEVLDEQFGPWKEKG